MLILIYYQYKFVMLFSAHVFLRNLHFGDIGVFPVGNWLTWDP